MFKALLATIVLAIPAAFAMEIRGEMYEQGSNKGKKLFNYKNTNSDESSTTEITDNDGKVVVVETAQLKGSDLVRYEIEQKQIGAKAVIEVKGDQVVFTKEVDGKTKTDSEKKGDTLVVTSNFVRFIKDHWAQIGSGKGVDIRYAVWDRMETVGFTLSKVGEETIDGVKTVKVRMKASSFIIAAIVNPLYMYFSEDGSKLVALNGRVAPKKKNGEKWVDLDAEVFYHEQPDATAK